MTTSFMLGAQDAMEKLAIDAATIRRAAKKRGVHPEDLKLFIKKRGHARRVRKAGRSVFDSVDAFVHSSPKQMANLQKGLVAREKRVAKHVKNLPQRPSFGKMTKKEHTARRHIGAMDRLQKSWKGSKRYGHHGAPEIGTRSGRRVGTYGKPVSRMRMTDIDEGHLDFVKELKRHRS